MKTPSELTTPSYLMNFPFTVDNHTPNNVHMHVYTGEYNYPRAFEQFLGLYSSIVKEGGLVYLLPSEEDLQDLPYTANIGCYLPHTKDTVLISNFKSEPRRGEDRVGTKFLDSMRYKTVKCPYFWEGEADLKWIRDNLYICGYGMRSDRPSYWWMKHSFHMEVVPVLMTDEKLYHFDCMFFPLSNEKALVTTSVVDSEDVRSIEKYVEIIEVPKEFIYDGWTNVVRINNKILYNVPESDKSRKAFENLLVKLGYEPVAVHLGEFDKSGADLSCFIMHLNYKGRSNGN